MYIRLKWQNPNTVAVTVKIYRGTSPIDRANLTGLIATLSAGETTYDDVTVTAGVQYYYVFETYTATDRRVSQNIPLKATPRRGPGPTDLQYGDFNYGYYGSLMSANFINTTQLRAAIGMTVGTVTQVTPTWHKFARNGKTFFVPEGNLATTLTYDQLYAAGLVYGVDGNGPYASAAPVNQKRQVTIGQDVYWVRLMRIYNDDYAVFPPSITAVPEPTESFTCEWDDFTYPMCNWMPTVQRMANVANVTPPTLSAAGCWGQERLSAAAGSSAFIRMQAGANTRSGIAYRAGLPSNSAGGCWWPVLELIEAAA